MKFNIILLAFALFVSALPNIGFCANFKRPGSAEAAAADRANDQLSKVYKQLMSELSPSKQTQLRDEEKAWIKWRDQEAARITTEGGASGGSAYRVDFYNAQLKLINERTEKLRQRFK